MTSNRSPRQSEGARGPIWTKASGFTLAELLVVLVILSLAVGLVAARFPTQGPSAADLAHKAASTLRLAHAQAMREGRDTRVSFDLSTRTLLRDERVVQRWPDTVDVTVEGSQSEAVSGRYSVRFLPDGGSTGLRAVFEGESAQQVEVTVSWLTGEVRDGAS